MNKYKEDKIYSKRERLLKRRNGRKNWRIFL